MNSLDKVGNLPLPPAHLESVRVKLLPNCCQKSVSNPKPGNSVAIMFFYVSVRGIPDPLVVQWQDPLLSLPWPGFDSQAGN